MGVLDKVLSPMLLFLGVSVFQISSNMLSNSKTIWEIAQSLAVDFLYKNPSVLRMHPSILIIYTLMSHQF